MDSTAKASTCVSKATAGRTHTSRPTMPAEIPIQRKNVPGTKGSMVTKTSPRTSQCQNSG